MRVDVEDGLEYRFVGGAWVRNTPEVLEPLSSSAGFPEGSIGDLRTDDETGVLFRHDGSAWVLKSGKFQLADGSVDSDKVKDGSLEVEDFDPSVVAEAVVVLTDAAAVRNCGTTPIQLLPAPAAGFGYRVEDVLWRNSGGTENYAFDGMSGSRTLKLGDATLTNAGMMGQGSASNAYLTTYSLQRPGFHAITNAPITLTGNGDSATGDRVVTIKIRYRLVPLA